MDETPDFILKITDPEKYALKLYERESANTLRLIENRLAYALDGSQSLTLGDKEKLIKTLESLVKGL